MSMYTRITTMALVLGALAGCGSPQTTAPGGSAAPSQSVQLSPAASPAGQAATKPCDELQGVLTNVLQADVSVSPTTFRDISANVERAGCQVVATGTADAFGQWLELSQRLTAALASNGWSEGQPLADGPTGTVIGFSREQEVAQLTVDWQPAAGATCPADQPITACNLPLSQQQITVKIEAASTDVAAGSAAGVSEGALDEEALKQTVHTYVMENTSVRAFTISVDGTDGDVARVRVTAAGGEPTVGFARQVDGVWSVIALGGAFDPSWLNQHAIPQSLWPAQS